jgi:hypothetical protein
MRPRRLRRLAVLLVVPVVLSGCELFLPSPYYPPPEYPYDPSLPTLPPISIPSFEPDVSYSRGAANVALADGASISLAVVDEGSVRSGPFATVKWSNDEGWALTLTSVTYPDFKTPAYDNSIALENVNNGEQWVVDTTFDPTACRYSMEESSAVTIKGSAKCTGLRWQDARSTVPGVTAVPKYIEGQDPFDATITFEATSSR